MEGQMYTIDNAPVKTIQRKMIAYTIGGSFIDGYNLGIIEFALVLIASYMKMNSYWQGLIGSSPMIGIFVGSLFLGALSDKIGRQKIYTVNFIVVVIASILQFFVNTPGPLFVLRLLLGIAIGAEYAIGPALITEFEPARLRGGILANLNVSFSVGYVAAAFVGYLLQGMGAESWRWMLGSSAIFGAIVLIVRIGMPESPRWLVLNGQIDKAREVVKKYYGDNVTIDNIVEQKETSEVDMGYKHLFINGMWKKTVFCAVIWVVGALPMFGIITFLPTVLKTIGVIDENAGSMILTLFLLVGSIVAIFIIDRFPRKGLCIWTFAISGMPLFVLGLCSNMNSIMIVILFAVFLAFNVINGSLSGFVYPSEVFPTEVRSSGIGLCSAMSRIGAALGTFLLPVLMNAIGIGPVLIILGVTQVIGIIVTIAWGPETRRISIK